MKPTLVIILALGMILIGFNSCDEETTDKVFGVLSDVLGDGDDASVLFGWLENDENMDEIESDINFGTQFGDGNLPSSINLLDKFPPVGNQGAYGTCVAWACGYNLKTYLEAVDQNRTASQLSNTQYQFSPKDLFWSIPAGDKGDGCNGTGFESALDVMVSRGIATMSTVPYQSLGDCSSSPSSDWTNNASQYKLENYRKIGSEGNMDITTLKTYLADGRAVVIGAQLGDNFMNWNSDAVISSDTYLDPGMQHAYHAMILGGYNDSKSAFLVVNSWATSWGDDGFIWVDYDFFVDEFCFAAFV
ncbi:MAG: C1 family peptidase, partial [Bacteroidota bacterium]